VLLLRALSIPLGLAPPGSGQHALSRATYRALLRRHSPEIPALQTMRSGARLMLDLRERPEGEAFLARRYEPGLTRYIARQLPPGGTFFDVGAHVGLVTLEVGALRDWNVTVHAFEPNPESASRLQRNALLNADADVLVRRTAVGARPGETTITWAPEDSALTATREAAGTAPRGPAEERVPVTTLDVYASENQVRYVDVVKLDVEGGEEDVLEGSSELLAEGRVGCVVCEFNDAALSWRGTTREAIRDRMAAWGYHLRELPTVGLQRRGRHRAAQPIVDVAFVPDTRP
jgi:FkbM family methyltransferase